MTNLLTWRYWFTLRPENLSSLMQNLFTGFIGVLILLAILTIIIKRKGGVYRGFFTRFYNFCLGNAFIGLIFYFFNYEMVPFFSARFWLAIWALVMLVWLILILKRLKNIPLQKKKHEEENEIKKYLP